MIVIGKQAFVFSHSCKYVDIQDFDKEVKYLLKVPVVYAVIAYDCTSLGETYMLFVRNYLCVPTMDNNLIPHFFRETGLILNDAPKIICTGPSVEDHFLFDEETGLRLPFTLNGTFSMFETRSITEDEIKNAENYPTISLTLDSNRWDT